MIEPNWTPEQDHILRENPRASHSTLAWMVSKIGPARTTQAVKGRRQYINLAEPVSSWSDPARLDRLGVLYGAGYSSSQIARMLNEEFKAELSRNAVIGKIHRLGIRKPERFKVTVALSNVHRVRRSPPGPSKAARMFQHGGGCEIGQTPKAAPFVALVGPTPDSLNIPMWDTRFKAGCCKYATGEDEHGHLFCAAPVALKGVYCGSHEVACRQAGSGDQTKYHLKPSARAFGDETTAKWWKPDQTTPVDEAVDPDKQRGRFKSVRFAAFGEEAA